MEYLMMEFILTFGTLGFVLALAYVNIRQTERQLKEKRDRSAAPTGALAAK